MFKSKLHKLTSKKVLVTGIFPFFGKERGLQGTDNVGERSPLRKKKTNLDADTVLSQSYQPVVARLVLIQLNVDFYMF